MEKYIKNLIVSLAIVISILLLANASVFASQYGEEEEEIDFEFSKKVHFEGDDDWKDRITGVDENDTVEFRIKIKNVGDKEVDEMKIEDFLPDEMFRVGGSGLTEYWNNFEPGETKEFIIEAKVESEEFDRDDDFEKCVVNEAELRYDDDFIDDDFATVCYGTVPEKLPDTGYNSVLAPLGLALIALGSFIKKRS